MGNKRWDFNNRIRQHKERNFTFPSNEEGDKIIIASNNIACMINYYA